MSVDSKVKLICSCEIVQYSLFKKLILLNQNDREKCQNEYNFVIVTRFTFNQAYFWMFVHRIAWCKTFNSNQHLQLYPVRQTFYLVRGGGNLCFHLFNFLLCIPELCQHATCGLLCRVKCLFVIKFFQKNICGESCT